MADNDPTKDDNEIVASQDIHAATSGDEETITCSDLIPMAQSKDSQIAPFSESQLSTFSSNSHELAIPNPEVSVSIPQGQFPGANFGPQTKKIQKTTHDNRGQMIQNIHHHYYPDSQPSTSFTPGEPTIFAINNKYREWLPGTSQDREKRGFESGKRKHVDNGRDQEVADDPDMKRERRHSRQYDDMIPREGDPRNREEGIKIAKNFFLHGVPLKKDTNIYEGHQNFPPRDHLDIAVKLFHPHDRRNFKEISHLLRLKYHQNVVQIISSVEIHYPKLPMPMLYIFMELCSKKTLQDYVNDETHPRDIHKTMSYSEQLVAGVRFIHEKKIIHMDLNLDNILLSIDEKYIKVTGFTLSNDDRPVIKPDGWNNGTVIARGYRAPEMYACDQISKLADIFSLGLIMHMLWTNGQHPFGDLDERVFRIKKKEQCNISELTIPDVKKNSQLLTLLTKMLQFDPKTRPTAEEIAKNAFFWGGCDGFAKPKESECTQNTASANASTL